MQLPNEQKFTTTYEGRELSFIVSDAAGQANASVIGTYGETSVLVTAVMGKEDRDVDFFPLTVDYEERFYAAGKVLGSRFVRREGRPSDFAILSGRLIDRTIRPLFDQRLRREVQVVVTILSYDEENDPDFIALLTTSLALSISDIPWDGPVAGVRVLKNNGDRILNPTNSQAEDALEKDGALDAFFAGTKNRVNMIEMAGNEAQEDEAHKVFDAATEGITTLIAEQEKIIKKIGKTKADVTLVQLDPKMEEEVKAFAPKFEKALFCGDAQKSEAMMEEAKNELFERLEAAEIDTKGVGLIMDDVINEIVHRHGIEKEERVDGRSMDTIRDIYCETGLFKRLHGSAYFSRGKTQSLAVTTLAPPGSEQLVETMEHTIKRRFMLHYNFPPYSTGETGRMGSPKRREIGHGALAAKALRPVIPSQNEFPYTVRVVSEILSSNGSSSMASVCTGTLSLMDAGVPIKKPVAGIAMGLMTWQGVDRKRTEDDFKILTDIQGPEDHYGDMDFKVAGTVDGITAIQMDVKIEGITKDIFTAALKGAKKARMQLLEKITAELSSPRKNISPFAPMIITMSINPDQIGEVIGSGGKVINGIIERFGLDTIDIEEDGSVFIAGSDRKNVESAAEYVKELTREYHVGDVVEGPVIKLMEFGAIVDLGGGKDGMVHVSEVNNDYVRDIKDVLKIGEVVRAKVVRAENGRIALSMKALNPATPSDKNKHDRRDVTTHKGHEPQHKHHDK